MVSDKMMMQAIIQAAEEAAKAAILAVTENRKHW